MIFCVPALPLSNHMNSNRNYRSRFVLGHGLYPVTRTEKLILSPYPYPATSTCNCNPGFLGSMQMENKLIEFEMNQETHGKFKRVTVHRTQECNKYHKHQRQITRVKNAEYHTYQHACYTPERYHLIGW